MNIIYFGIDISVLLKNLKMFDKNQFNLKGKLLIAMPDIGDERFKESVIIICDHNMYGSMGIVINSHDSSLNFKGILDELQIEQSTNKIITIQSGGPVESSRGFILHSNDYKIESTNFITEDIFLTASIEIIKDIACDKGPKNIKFTLGYAGWNAGQLEKEIQQNLWLHTSARDSLVFSSNVDNIWSNSVKTLGIDISHLNHIPGHA